MAIITGAAAGVYATERAPIRCARQVVAVMKAHLRKYRKTDSCCLVATDHREPNRSEPAASMSAGMEASKSRSRARREPGAYRDGAASSVTPVPSGAPRGGDASPFPSCCRISRRPHGSTDAQHPALLGVEAKGCHCGGG